jgi:hypothetical protein
VAPPISMSSGLPGMECPRHWASQSPELSKTESSRCRWTGHLGARYHAGSDGVSPDSEGSGFCPALIRASLHLLPEASPSTSRSSLPLHTGEHTLPGWSQKTYSQGCPSSLASPYMHHTHRHTHPSSQRSTAVSDWMMRVTCPPYARGGSAGAKKWSQFH